MNRGAGGAAEVIRAKRRTHVVGLAGLTPRHWRDGSASLPNQAAIVRLVGALMLEQNDEWAVTRRYMTLETMEEVCNDQTVDVAQLATV